jgi:hypothetical protein
LGRVYWDEQQNAGALKTCTGLGYSTHWVHHTSLLIKLLSLYMEPFILQISIRPPEPSGPGWLKGRLRELASGYSGGGRVHWRNDYPETGVRD